MDRGRDFYQIWISRQNSSSKFLLGRVKMRISNRKKSIKRDRKCIEYGCAEDARGLKKKKKKSTWLITPNRSLFPPFVPLFLLSPQHFHPEPERSSITQNSSSSRIQSKSTKICQEWLKMAKNVQNKPNSAKTSHTQLKIWTSVQKFLSKPKAAKIPKIGQNWLIFAKKGQNYPKSPKLSQNRP